MRRIPEIVDKEETMDLRKERTKRSIINAFIELRANRPLEKITVKELSERAMINKATFYSHYKDIYDLSEQLEKETIDRILMDISHPEDFITRTKQASQELTVALSSQNRLIDILFSDSRASILANCLEQRLKKRIYMVYPEYEEEPDWDILLTVLIQGSFHAYVSHSKQMDNGLLIEILGDINERMLKKQPDDTKEEGK